MNKIGKYIKNRKILIFAAILGIMYSCVLVWGKGYLEGNSIHYYFESLRCIAKYTLIIGALSIPVGLLFAVVIGYLTCIHDGIQAASNKEVIGKRQWVFIWLLLIAAYIPCFICFYPGITSYDAFNVISEAMGLEAKSNFQPYFHTFIVSCFFAIEKATGIQYFAVLANSVLQLIAVTSAITYSLKKLSKILLPKWYIVVSFCFYAFSPAIVVFTYIVTKDVLFGALFLILTWAVYDVIVSGDLNKVLSIKLVVCSVSCSLLRNNMIYVVICVGMVMIAVVNKHRLQIIIITIVSVVMYLFVVNNIYGYVGVEKSQVQEKLSVPIMQLSSVYLKRNVELDDETKEEILFFIPDVEKYIPMNAAPAKGTFNREAYGADSSRFWRLYIGMFKKYPIEYIDAFLNLHLPYVYPDIYVDKPYIENSNAANGVYYIERNSCFSQLRNFYEDTCTNYDGYKSVGVIRIFFALNIPFWLILVSIAVMMITGKKKCIIILLPSLLLWMTYMLGPVCNFRYIYPLVLLYPVYVGIAVSKTDIKVGKANI